MICSWRCCKYSSCEVVCCSSCLVMQSGILVVVCMALIFRCIPGISASLFSLWFCLDSQSAMTRSGPGLYMMLTLYRCILSRIHCSLCGSVATSFFKYCDYQLVICNYTHLSHKAVMMEVHIVYLVLLFLCCYIFFSALDRLLLANAMGLRILLFGASSLEQLVPLIVCSRAALSPTPDASLFMYSGLVSSYNFINASFFDWLCLINYFLVCHIPSPLSSSWCQFSWRFTDVCSTRRKFT